MEYIWGISGERTARKSRGFDPCSDRSPPDFLRRRLKTLTAVPTRQREEAGGGLRGLVAGPLPRACAADSGDTARLLFYFFYSNLNLVFTNDF